jgi:HSP20 family protein
MWGDWERDFANRIRQMFDWEVNGGEAGMSFAPNVNVAETESGYEVSADLPGMKPDQVHVEFSDGCLWISGERKCESEEKNKRFHRIERCSGEFRRAIRLGSDVDAESINAKFRDGVLTIAVAKSEMARPKQIEIHT